MVVELIVEMHKKNAKKMSNLLSYLLQSGFYDRESMVYSKTDDDTRKVNK